MRALWIAIDVTRDPQSAGVWLCQGASRPVVVSLFVPIDFFKPTGKLAGRGRSSVDHCVPSNRRAWLARTSSLLHSRLR